MVTRNAGMALDEGWLEQVHVNLPGANRRAQEILAGRSLKKQWQVAWQLRAVTLIDLTTLSGDDGPSNVRRLCCKAKRPVRQDLLDALGLSHKVATGFPSGQTGLWSRLDEIRQAVAAGAKEIDIVVNRTLVLSAKWNELYQELRTCRQACGEAHMKTILAVGELGSLTNVYRASLVAMMAGSDFIKTSTGKETVNATFPAGVVMTRAIWEYYQRTGFKVGFKPAGGIRTAKDALCWLTLIAEELGIEWLQPELFRLGASSLLLDIERQIFTHVTGRYAAAQDFAMA
uniref:deoxyribose-phosphate aldolase n=1 Tax=Eptatretus burgeri TaxID=7764 RepID=A0A8C4QIM0_EPTBU